MLSISRPTLYRLLSKGELRSVRVGARQRIPASELERLMAASTAVAPVHSPASAPATVPAATANRTTAVRAAVTADAAPPRAPEKRLSLSQLIAATNGQRRSSAD